jgi:hypothetical protein
MLGAMVGFGGVRYRTRCLTGSGSVGYVQKVGQKEVSTNTRWICKPRTNLYKGA